MRTKSFSTAGALHPILFFAFMYIVVLLFSIFICSSLFYSCKSSSERVASKEVPAEQKAMPVQVSTVAVLR